MHVVATEAHSAVGEALQVRRRDVYGFVVDGRVGVAEIVDHEVDEEIRGLVRVFRREIVLRR